MNGSYSRAWPSGGTVAAGGTSSYWALALIGSAVAVPDWDLCPRSYGVLLSRFDGLSLMALDKRAAFMTATIRPTWCPNPL